MLETSTLRIFLTKSLMILDHRSPNQNDLDRWLEKLHTTPLVSHNHQFVLFSKLQKQILTVNQLQLRND
jgi:hypothetical protein